MTALVGIFLLGRARPQGAATFTRQICLGLLGGDLVDEQTRLFLELLAVLVVAVRMRDLLEVLLLDSHLLGVVEVSSLLAEALDRLFLALGLHEYGLLSSAGQDRFNLVRIVILFEQVRHLAALAIGIVTLVLILELWGDHSV